MEVGVCNRATKTPLGKAPRGSSGLMLFFFSRILQFASCLSSSSLVPSALIFAECEVGEIGGEGVFALSFEKKGMWIFFKAIKKKKKINRCRDVLIMPLN